jgi:hypothetical protein
VIDVALGATEDEVLMNALVAWESLRFHEADLGELRELYDRALSHGWTQSACNLLSWLHIVNHPDAALLSLEFLQDPRIESWPEPLVPAANIAYRCAELSGDASIRDRLEGIARAGLVDRGRAQAAGYLHRMTREPQWMEIFLGFAESPNALIRLQVALQLRWDGRSEHRDLLERLSKDEDGSVRDAALQALGDLK